MEIIGQIECGVLIRTVKRRTLNPRALASSDEFMSTVNNICKFASHKIQEPKVTDSGDKETTSDGVLVWEDGWFTLDNSKGFITRMTIASRGLYVVGSAETKLLKQLAESVLVKAAGVLTLGDFLQDALIEYNTACFVKFQFPIEKLIREDIFEIISKSLIPRFELPDFSVELHVSDVNMAVFRAPKGIDLATIGEDERAKMGPYHFRIYVVNTEDHSQKVFRTVSRLPIEDHKALLIKIEKALS